MPDWLTSTALTVGLLVMASAALAVLVLAVLAIWRFWPVLGCLITLKKTRFKTGGQPRIDWQVESGSYTKLNALIGLTSRGKIRWFFGLMLMDGDHCDPALAAARRASFKGED